VALHFALPGLMSMFALIDTQTAVFWRVSFGIVGIGGAVVMITVRGFPVPRGRDQAGVRQLPVADRLGLAAYLAAVVPYVLIGVLGGQSALRTEAVLQTLLVFLGFNVAWLLLLDDRKPSPSPARPSVRTE